MRRARRAVLGENLFSDPAWDILLELYAAHLGGRGVLQSEFAQRIQIPGSTTARWVAALKERGLVQSETDATDVDQATLYLTNEGAARMEKLAGQWASVFISI